MPTTKPALCQLGVPYLDWIHDELIGGLWPEIDPVSTKEYRSRELLESALGRPFHSMGGQDLYPTIIDKAAALFHSLIANHPYTNGNKRTAVVAVDAFLMGNGRSIALDNDAMYKLASDTASYRQRGITHDDSLREIVAILTKFSIPLRVLYQVQRKNPQLATFYRANMNLRRSVRTYPGNKLIPVD